MPRRRAHTRRRLPHTEKGRANEKIRIDLVEHNIDPNRMSRAAQDAVTVAAYFRAIKGKKKAKISA